MLKRILSLLLVLVLFAVPVAAEDGYDAFPEEEFFNDMGSVEEYTEGLGITAEQYEQLKDTIYGATRECAANCSILSFGIPYNSETLQLLNYFIRKGDPETFHVDTISSTGSGYGSNRVFSQLKFTYICTKAEYDEMRAEMIAEADRMLEGVEGNDALTDVQKALVLHDRLAVHCEYDVEAYYAGTTSTHDYTMYGAMVGRRCVCEGYTKAYSYLLDRVGIENYYCDSSALGHIWNILYIDGEKYHVDVTWDDPVYDITGYVTHDYFLCSTEKMMADQHNADDYDTTPVSTVYDDAFWGGVNTSFILFGNDLYFVEESTGDFKKWSGGDFTTLGTITEKWRSASGGYYAACFSCTARDDKFVYYSLPKSVVRYDPVRGTTSTLYEYTAPSDNRYLCIYGIKTEDMTLTVDVNTNPVFGETTKADYEFTVPYTHPGKRGDANGDNTVNVQDLAVLKKYIASADMSAISFFWANADVNGDGTVGVQDIKSMKTMIAGG